jgi:glutamine synthetase
VAEIGGVTFAELCGLHDAAREAACARIEQLCAEQGIERVRIAWCDLHGQLRGKTLVGRAIGEALREGIGMVSTLMLKDSGDRTVVPVFDATAAGQPDGFAFANNLMLLPDPASFRLLPWAAHTGWMQAQPWFDDGRPVALDTRRILEAAVAALRAAGYSLHCGLEVEFHVYRIDDDRLDPQRAAWPGEAPEVSMLHPGYHLLAESHADLADDALRIVQRTAQDLALPLRSLEIELGPSQFEAVFDAADALTSADRMVLFRSAVKQALRRAGYHASFMCRPPFANVMASGWHLHQSLVDAQGRNAFVRERAEGPPRDARQVLSAAGTHWLAGLLAHARGMTVLAAPTINGLGRFRPNALAPHAIVWGRDNRGAMLRVIGAPGHAATRIENRIGEPAANPYLYFAAQIWAGLDGLARGLEPPPATEAPYADGQGALPRSLPEAIDALRADAALVQGFGVAFVDLYERAKRQEAARHDAAEDRQEWERREYFARL